MSELSKALSRVTAERDQALRSLAASRKEVARLTEERDDWKATSELAGFPSNVAAQQREDIRRLVEALESAGGDYALLAEMRERLEGKE